jgi:hypothetical protein
LSHNNTATKFPAGHLNLHLLAMPGVLLVPTVLGGLMLL